MSAAAVASPNAKTTVPKPAGFAWIISPAWDLLFFVLTPLLIVPAVFASQRYFTNQQIWLAVMSFGSVGHHLPGFLRAYGDPELFARFRVRLLLVPPLVFATSWWFTSRELHGLRVLILLWATWHGLMQTYGFMRIYDLKRGVRDAGAARLDFWLCVALFTAGTVFSPPRTFGILQAMWESGLPIFDPGVVTAARAIVGVATGGILIAYLLNLSNAARRGAGVTWNKVLLAVSTAGIWWLCGVAQIDTLVGVAMFEIYHAVQYLAIVWVFNRRTAERLGEKLGPLGAVMRQRWALLGLYLGLVAGFGALRFFTEGIEQQQLAQLFISVLATSTVLHYYFDGFIWKVRERNNQVPLNLENPAAGISPKLVPGLLHAAKWALFFVPAMILLKTEYNERTPAAAQQEPGSQESSRAPSHRRAAMAATLARVTPDLAAAQLMAADAALDAGDLAAAVKAGQAAVRLDPQMGPAHATLGSALRLSNDLPAATAAYRRALELNPGQPDYHYNLAGALRDSRQWEAGQREYLAALAAAPGRDDIRRDLGVLYKQWAGALSDAGDHEQALEKLREAVRRSGNDAELIRLAVLMLSRGDNSSPPARALRQAVKAGDWAEAARQVAQSTGLAASGAAICTELGTQLWSQHQVGAAEGALRAAVSQDPRLAEAHYQLGCLLFARVQAREQLRLPDFDQTDLSQARGHLRQARQLGRSLPENIAQFVDGP